MFPFDCQADAAGSCAGRELLLVDDKQEEVPDVAECDSQALNQTRRAIKSMWSPTRRK